LTTADWYRWDRDTLLVDILVSPRASRNQVAGVQDGRLKLKVTGAPVEGKANAAVAVYLAKAFGVPRSQVTLVSGLRGRKKRLAVSSPRRLPAWFTETR
jgi:uncharacterized protein (TIGR00251 family)